MTALEILEAKHSAFCGSSLHYLIGIDESEYQVCEIDGSESYCSDCIDKIVKERNEELKRIGYDEFYNTHDCSSSEEFKQISYSTEFSPERDDFELCENCGCEIYVAVLFTFDQEIEYWIDQDIDLENISDQDAYRIYECITSFDAIQKHPKSVEKLKQKLNNHGNK
nr:MAG TPA_asm: hypothetical protein [Caudoviricetes sp.]